MPSRLRHKQDTSDFDGLTFAGQAKAITMHINQVVRAVSAHCRRAEAEGRDVDAIKEMRIAQLRRALERLER